MPIRRPKRPTVERPPADHEARYRPAPDIDMSAPVPPPPRLPDPVDDLPPKGSACRWCGVRVTDPADRFGGPAQVGELDSVPADALNVRRTRVESGCGPAYDRQGKRVAPPSTEVQRFDVPLWRYCQACTRLADGEQPIELLCALLSSSLPRDPVHLAAAGRHAPTPYYLTPGADRFDRGNSAPWAHVEAAAIEAARIDLEALKEAGGIPHPSGKPCAVCGRTNSPYGWREEMWRPPGNDSATPLRVPVCGGVRNVHNPAAPRWSQWTKEPVGCEVLLNCSRNELSAPLHELAWKAAEKAGAALPSWTHLHLADVRWAMAWAHPEYATSGIVRGPWWHLADAPLREPSPQEQLADRLAKLEALVNTTGGAA